MYCRECETSVAMQAGHKKVVMYCPVLERVIGDIKTAKCKLGEEDKECKKGFKEAIADLTEAQNYLDHAGPDMIDEAVYRYTYAETKLKRIIREMKKAPAELEPKQGATKRNLSSFIIAQIRGEKKKGETRKNDVP